MQDTTGEENAFNIAKSYGNEDVILFLNEFKMKKSAAQYIQKLFRSSIFKKSHTIDDTNSSITAENIPNKKFQIIFT